MQASHAEHYPTKEARSRLLLASLVLGSAFAYACFVLFLQTPAISRARLALAVLAFVAVSAANYFAALRWALPRLVAEESRGSRLMIIGLILVAVFLPLLYQSPRYPESPLLRPWTELAVEFELSAGSRPISLAFSDVKMIMGRDAPNAKAFQPVGNWNATESALTLSPGQTGSLQWAGTAPAMITLVIQPPEVDGWLTVYWDGARETIELKDGSARAPISITQRFARPWAYDLAFMLALYVLGLWGFILAGLVLAPRIESIRHVEKQRPFLWALLLFAVVLTILTVAAQINSLPGRTAYLTTEQLSRHAAVLRGDAPNPWQYRVLSEYVAEALIRSARVLATPNALVTAFISLRLTQNLAIFLAAFALYRKVTASNLLALLGILILACSMRNAFYDNDLAFNTYFDLLAYLLCGLLLVYRGYWGVVILTFLAALNRESSGLLPLLLAAAIWDDHSQHGRKYLLPIISAAIFISIFIGLRLLYPDRPLYIPYKHPPGFELFLYNLTRPFTWAQLFSTLGLVPLLGVTAFTSWPALWQRFFLILCPVWFVVHFFASVAGETRLFLVPQALVFIPGVLFLLMVQSGSTNILYHPS